VDGTAAQGRTAGGRPASDIDPQGKDEVNRLIHEVRVHQAELELQNDELSRSRDSH
jgi:AraC-like DNA-binding protein